MSAIWLVKKCRESGLSITIKSLLSARGISDLSHKAGSLEPDTNLIANRPTNPSVNGSNEGSLRLPADIDLSNVECILPCTPIQEHMLTNETQGFYHVLMRFGVELTGDLDVSRLEKAWNEVIMRHSALRIIFATDQEHLKTHKQVILRAPAKKSLTWKKQSSELTHNTTFIQTTNDWKIHEPRHCLTLQRNGSGNTTIILEISHAITDAVSLGIVFRDLALAYDEHLFGPPAAQYPDFLGELGRTQIDSSSYWRKYLFGVKPCLLTKDTTLSSSGMQLLHMPVSHPGTYRIIPFYKRLGVSVSHFFHMAWALLLRSYLGSQKEVSFGYLNSNRDVDLEGVEGIVGPLLCMLVCRQQIPNSRLLRESLKAIRDDAVNSMNKRYCDIQQIEADIGLNGKGLFNTMINFR